MVLVDTSVWIRFFANRAPYAVELDRLLALDEIVGHDLVYGELLIGDKGGRTKFLEAYEAMKWAAAISHVEVVGFVRDRRFYGRGASWIDMHLVASAIAGQFQLWTADSRLGEIALELGLAYEGDVAHNP